jgi:hypothetical protein
MSLIFFIIAIVVLILAFLFLAKLLVENVPKKFFPYISLLLLLISVFLGYKIVDSVVGDIKFNKEKAVRYQKAIDGLKLIRDAEVAYKNVKGDYTSDYTKLIEFIETGSNPILQTIEKTINVVDRGVAREKEIKVIDTIGWEKVIKDFENRDYKNMMYIPGTTTKYELKTGYVEKGKDKYKAPVFEAKISKVVVLEGLRKDLLQRELSAEGIDEVNGEFITVGTLEDVKETGNWPPVYDSRKISDTE